MKTPKFLLDDALKLIVTGVLIATLFVIAQADHNTPEALEARIASEGKLNIVEAPSASTSAAAPKDGQAVYDSVCATCHDSGIAGAPKTGDVDAWRARIAQGNAVLEAHAIEGYQGESGFFMPAKGGNPALSDAEVAAAVAYLVEQSK